MNAAESPGLRAAQAVFAFTSLVIATSCSPARDADEANVAVPPPPKATASATRVAAEDRRAHVELDERALAACIDKLRDAEDVPSSDPAVAVYRRGREAERAGRRDDARKAYFEAVQEPKSVLVPHSYYAFGWLFEEDAAQDPAKLEFAAQSYEQVLKHGQTPLALPARYRLSRIYAQQKEHEKQLSALMAVAREVTMQKAACPDQLAAAVRRDIVPAYAEMGDPRKAFNFFRPSFGAMTAADLSASLAETYDQQGKREDAQRVTAAALAGLPEPPARLCGLARLLMDARGSEARAELEKAGRVCGF
ncbi:MAG: hypothetical protein HOW73_04010 [Polyangiaceae bacterium]|nr:hypothetical protein [Polyangiaceae bacterium]